MSTLLLKPHNYYTVALPVFAQNNLKSLCVSGLGKKKIFQ